MSTSLIEADATGARRRVALYLALLSSEACRTAWRPDLPEERRAYELVSLWFDVIYVPSTRYVDGLKGDTSREASEAFLTAFTPKEQEALHRFHCFLELRIDMLGDGHRQARVYPFRDGWASLVRDAAYLLEELERDPEDLRKMLAAVLSAQADDDRPAAFLGPPR